MQPVHIFAESDCRSTEIHKCRVDLPLANKWNRLCLALQRCFHCSGREPIPTSHRSRTDVASTSAPGLRCTCDVHFSTTCSILLARLRPTMTTTPASQLPNPVRTSSRITSSTLKNHPSQHFAFCTPVSLCRRATAQCLPRSKHLNIFFVQIGVEFGLRLGRRVWGGVAGYKMGRPSPRFRLH
jgi:hypothetical protein